MNARHLADEREALLWSLVNCFHSQMTRLDRAVDRITREMRDLEHAQDGTEVKAHELETLTDRVRNLPRADCQRRRDYVPARRRKNVPRARW